MNIESLINSMKGISGSGTILAESIKALSTVTRTLEPGDLVRTNPPLVIAAPIAYDLWYLWCHANFMSRYYADIDGDHFDYTPYLNDKLDFLSGLSGLKPVKTLRDLEKHLVGAPIDGLGFWEMRFDFANNGVYWINLLAWELHRSEISIKYASDGPKGLSPNDYIGYISFPIGQLGVMEVISLVQEIDLRGYVFSGGQSPSPSGYLIKSAVTPKTDEIPTVQSPAAMFPEMKDAGQNHCFGRHLVESAYIIPTTPIASQNEANSSGGTAYAPIPERDAELWATQIPTYPEDIKPKKWLRYWIHKDSTLPVPGEFIGILCKPLAVPPHVWWFQESSPLLYAGNWMETRSMTSGVVTEVTLEASRLDGKVGNQYKIKVQGCVIVVEATDFFIYAVGDRVAVLKLDTTQSAETESFTWLNQMTLQVSDEQTAKVNYIIVPATFYKVVH